MTPVRNTFDIIVVGAGTAACVLANRLSEDSDLSIAVLEAGEDHSKDERVYTPGLAPVLPGDSVLDWQYVSEPEPGLNGRCMKHPRGKLVGGTSAINSFALIYPSKAGIDVWADAGADGWDWETLKTYFRKFQTICEPSEEVRKELNIYRSKDNTNGPIQAAFPQCANELQKAWVETFRNLDLENTSDPLEGKALGGHTSTCHISGDRRERSHAGVAYLDPVRTRSNLHVITGALVEKILFDKSGINGSVATGVVYTNANGERQICHARREVILAAGTFNTPQLLELSGIGNPKTLNSYGIEIVYANAAVGENLQDHIRTGLSFEAIEDLGPRDPQSADECRKLYEHDRTGPWADKTASSFAYMPLQQFLDESEKRELSALLHKHLDDPNVSTDQLKRNEFVRAMIESRSEATTTLCLSQKPATLKTSGGKYITLFSMLSHPLSTGSVHITSINPKQKPAIHFNYYTHPLDIEIHALHAQVLEKIAHTAPLSTYIKPHRRKLPQGCDVSTIEGAKSMIRSHASTNYHPCGTCAIGTVVDARLRVFGTRNVRVMDASVMPIIPRGNIIATVYAVAERAADILKEDWSRSS